MRRIGLGDAAADRQADTEAADLARERAELASDPLFERQELAAIYQARGLPIDSRLSGASIPWSMALPPPASRLSVSASKAMATTKPS